MRVVLTIILTLVVVALGVVAFYLFMVYSGTYSVRARPEEGGFLQDTLDKTMDHSVAHNSASVNVPPLDDPSMIRQGAIVYGQTCAQCHGAPGQDPGAFTKGMDPTPPKFDDFGKNMPPASIFWVAKNGIEMTGMPAFRTVAPDQTIWGVVALIKRLPTMSPAEYQSLMKQTGS